MADKYKNYVLVKTSYQSSNERRVSECWHKCSFHVSIPEYVRIFSSFLVRPVSTYSLHIPRQLTVPPCYSQWHTHTHTHTHTHSIGLLCTRDRPVADNVLQPYGAHVSLQLLFQTFGVRVNISRFSAEMRSETCVRHLKCPTLLSDCNKTLNVHTIFFLQNSAIQNISSALLQFNVPYSPCSTRPNILNSLIKRVTSQAIYQTNRLL